MTNFANLKLIDQLTVMVAVLIVFLAVATMIVVGSHSLKRWFRNRLIGLVIIIERINDKWFDDDEAFNEEWMDREAWERTRIKR